MPRGGGAGSSDPASPAPSPLSASRYPRAVAGQRLDTHPWCCAHPAPVWGDPLRPGQLITGTAEDVVPEGAARCARRRGSYTRIEHRVCSARSCTDPCASGPATPQRGLCCHWGPSALSCCTASVPHCRTPCCPPALAVPLPQAKSPCWVFGGRRWCQRGPKSLMGLKGPISHPVWFLMEVTCCASLQ